MTESGMNFHDRAPKIPPRILCIGIPVRDLTFRVSGVPGRGSSYSASNRPFKNRARHLPTMPTEHRNFRATI